MLYGTVTDERGAPVPSALVEVTMGTKTFSTLTDDKGNYQLGNLPTGQATVRVHADGYEDGRNGIGTVVTITALDPRLSSRNPKQPQGTRAALRVTRVAEIGQIRGLVRSFDGRIVPAAVRVEPLGIEVTTDAEGSFHIDVQPGSYHVRVRANGYVEQKRRVTVEDDGVTVLNVDLRRQRGAKRSRK